MGMNHSSCHDPPSLHPLLPGGVGYHCSAEPKGGNDVSATFACMDTWQPFVGWLPLGWTDIAENGTLSSMICPWKNHVFRHLCWFTGGYICWYVLPKISQKCYWYWFAKMWTGPSTISWFFVPMSQVSRCCSPRYFHEIHPPKGVLCIESGGCSPVKFGIEHLIWKPAASGDQFCEWKPWTVFFGFELFCVNKSSVLWVEKQFMDVYWLTSP